MAPLAFPNMRHRRMGRSGLSVARLALGTMGWGASTTIEAARDHLKAYLAAGGDFVDTAHGYADGASEEALGTMLGDLVPRDQLVICTKAGISDQMGTRVVDTSRRALMSQLDVSLGRLGTAYVDLWLVHTWSEQTPLEETLSALEWAVTSGRARYIGVSNYCGWQAAHAATLMSEHRIPLVANEVEYSLLNRIPEDELVAAGQALGFPGHPWDEGCSPGSTAMAQRMVHASWRANSTHWQALTSPRSPISSLTRWRSPRKG
jgi:aryl-alcohol dehydrogenase-like predicted oxidoreductase